MKCEARMSKVSTLIYRSKTILKIKINYWFYLFICHLTLAENAIDLDLVQV